ncbi:MAG TPA: aspartate kinase [Vicinamibacterales bacterium]|nr:aspartate kinase [Vicinamibacterales bacterium]
MRVLKFGGTSVADRAAIERLSAIVRREAAADRQSRNGARPGVVVVVSALAGVTDQLLAVADLARRSEGDQALAILNALRDRHREVASMIADAPARSDVCTLIDQQFHALAAAVRAVSLLREVSPRSLDSIAATGEILSSRLVAAALDSPDLRARWADPRTLIVTDETFTCAVPLLAETGERIAAALGGPLAAGEVVVTGGFVGASLRGLTTTLGRGGSDYSASIIGGALGADEIQIWTDVDGMLTADPRVYPAPRVVPHLSFAEAAELAYFGAKVLHPKTIQPALSRGIPVRILNSRRPDAPGTLITAKPDRSAAPVTALACKRSVTVIDVTSTRMLEAYGFLRRLFEVFERHQTSVDVVTTSEVSVSVTIDDRRHLDAIVRDLSAFAEVAVEDSMALVGVVGDNLPADPATFARIVSALVRTPLKLVSQAASRRNVTVVLPESQLAAAVAALHDEFFGATVAAGVPADAAVGESRVEGARS